MLKQYKLLVNYCLLLFSFKVHFQLLHTHIFTYPCLPLQASHKHRTHIPTWVIHGSLMEYGKANRISVSFQKHTILRGFCPLQKFPRAPLITSVEASAVSRIYFYWRIHYNIRGRSHSRNYPNYVSARDHTSGEAYAMSLKCNIIGTRVDYNNIRIYIVHIHVYTESLIPPGACDGNHPSPIKTLNFN